MILYRVNQENISHRMLKKFSIIESCPLKDSATCLKIYIDVSEIENKNNFKIGLILGMVRSLFGIKEIIN